MHLCTLLQTPPPRGAAAGFRPGPTQYLPLLGVLPPQQASPSVLKRSFLRSSIWRWCKQFFCCLPLWDSCQLSPPLFPPLPHWVSLAKPSSHVTRTAARQAQIWSQRIPSPIPASTLGTKHRVTTSGGGPARGWEICWHKKKTAEPGWDWARPGVELRIRKTFQICKKNGFSCHQSHRPFWPVCAPLKAKPARTAPGGY